MRPPPPVTQPSGGAVVAVDLPVPAGDPTELRRAAATLRVAAGAAGGCHLATGPLPSPAWAGPAAEAAQADSRLVGVRVGALGDRSGRAGAVLAEYADALEVAQRVTAGLQASAETAAVADPAALFEGVDTAVTAALAARYAGAVADLELAAEVAAHRLRELAGEVGDGPVGRGGQSGQSGQAVSAVRAPPGCGVRVAPTPTPTRRPGPDWRSRSASTTGRRGSASPARWSRRWGRRRSATRGRSTGRRRCSTTGAATRCSGRPCGPASPLSRRRCSSAPRRATNARRADRADPSGPSGHTGLGSSMPSGSPGGEPRCWVASWLRGDLRQPRLRRGRRSVTTERLGTARRTWLASSAA